MNDHKECVCDNCEKIGGKSAPDCGCGSPSCAGVPDASAGAHGEQPHADFNAELKAKGLKHTRHREAILELLASSEQPADAEQLHSELTERGFSLNLSTVYRTLDTLCAAGFVTRMTIDGDARALYEYNSAVHRHHLVCVGCKKITTIASCPLGGYEQQLESETGYAITGHKLDVYGLCPECRNRKKEAY